MDAHDPKFMLCSALQGLNGACQRFLAAATPSAPPEDVFVPLTEALWWAVSVDEGFAALAGPSIGKYRDTRNEDPWDACSGRSSSPGTGAATNAPSRGGRGRAQAAVRLPGDIGRRLRWRHTALPPVPRKYRKQDFADRQKEYDEILAGRPAHEALESTTKWFEQEQARAGLQRGQPPNPTSPRAARPPTTARPTHPPQPPL